MSTVSFFVDESRAPDSDGVVRQTMAAVAVTSPDAYLHWEAFVAAHDPPAKARKWSGAMFVKMAEHLAKTTRILPFAGHYRHTLTEEAAGRENLRERHPGSGHQSVSNHSWLMQVALTLHRAMASVFLTHDVKRLRRVRVVLDRRTFTDEHRARILAGVRGLPRFIETKWRGKIFLPESVTVEAEFDSNGMLGAADAIAALMRLASDDDEALRAMGILMTSAPSPLLARAYFSDDNDVYRGLLLHGENVRPNGDATS